MLPRTVLSLAIAKHCESSFFGAAAADNVLPRDTGLHNLERETASDDRLGGDVDFTDEPSPEHVLTTEQEGVGSDDRLRRDLDTTEEPAPEHVLTTEQVRAVSDDRLRRDLDSTEEPAPERVLTTEQVGAGKIKSFTVQPKLVKEVRKVSEGGLTRGQKVTFQYQLVSNKFNTNKKKVVVFLHDAEGTMGEMKNQADNWPVLFDTTYIFLKTDVTTWTASQSIG